MTTTVDLQAYVAPAMELVYEAGTPAFRGQWPKIEAMLELAAPVRGTGDWTAPYLYLPSQPVRADAGGWPRPALPHGVEVPEAALDDVEPGVLHDNPRGRLRAMDRAGVACQVISPGQSIEACIGLPSTLAAGVLGAYNRYILSYCAYAPDRLKAVLQVHAGEPHWSAREIEELAGDPSVAAVSVCMPVKIAPDERNFRPIWTALEAAGLPLLHRPAFSARVWTPNRLLNYLSLSGVLERHPGLRIGFAGSGVSWLMSYANGGEDGEANGSGRFFAAANGTEGALTVAAVAARSGIGCIVWESCFPYCNGTYSPGTLLDELTDAQRGAVLSANASRYLAHA
jgi:hypothetical protein